MRPRGLNTWKSNSLVKWMYLQWRGLFCSRMAVECLGCCHFERECERPGSLPDCVEFFRNIPNWLTSHGWVAVSLALPRFFGFGTLRQLLSLHRHVLLSVLWSWGAKEERFCRWLDPLSLGASSSSPRCLPPRLRGHRVNLPPLICRL